MGQNFFRPALYLGPSLQLDMQLDISKQKASTPMSSLLIPQKFLPNFSAKNGRNRRKSI
jgi:hypothetical protein